MPKATRSKASSARKDPIAKPAKDSKETPKSKPKPQTKKESRSSDSPTHSPPSKKPSKEKNPPTTKAPRQDSGKDSHLYTDDNPTTTLHGTGFKDSATATHTLQLISKRSLTYQFQTINTLYHRARNHPSIKKAKTPDQGPTGINDALVIFKKWLDETYPAAKAALRADGFKPLLSKTFVAKLLPTINESAGVETEAASFATLYCSLAKSRRLGNVLIDDSKPGEADWEVKRYDALNRLVPEGDEDGKGWEEGRLWEEKGVPSVEHLTLIAWGWSPVQERSLVGKVDV